MPFRDTRRIVTRWNLATNFRSRGDFRGKVCSFDTSTTVIVKMISLNLPVSKLLIF